MGRGISEGVLINLVGKAIPTPFMLCTEKMISKSKHVLPLYRSTTSSSHPLHWPDATTTTPSIPRAVAPGKGMWVSIRVKQIFAPEQPVKISFLLIILLQFLRKRLVQLQPCLGQLQTSSSLFVDLVPVPIAAFSFGSRTRSPLSGGVVTARVGCIPS